MDNPEKLLIRKTENQNPKLSILRTATIFIINNFLYFNMNKEDLEKIITKLIELGEDKDELDYWLDIFDDLSADKQKEVFSNFQEELTALSKLN